MSVHVLSGDSLVEPFKKTGIEGEIFVCRECLVDGDLSGDTLDEFWATRKSYLSMTYPDLEHDYSSIVIDEFNRICDSAVGNEVNLWFEYELFCQVNLWFTLWMLRDTESDIRIVYPKSDREIDIWRGFAQLDKDELKSSFDRRVSISGDDILRGAGLWMSFKDRAWDRLSELAKNSANVFPTIQTVAAAACSIESRPRELLETIVGEVGKDFGKVFGEFSRREAVYGFGDLQVKRIYDEIVINL